jgi:hypothetical protein
MIDAEVWLTERRLEVYLRKHRSRTDEEARRFLTFADRCIRETPVGPGQTPWGMTPAEFRQAVELAEGFLGGRATREQVRQAEQAVTSRALTTAGSAPYAADGPASAVWSAVLYVRAVETFALAGDRGPAFSPVEGQEEDACEGAAVDAIQAASLARRSATGQARLEAIKAQSRIAKSIWG